MWPVHSTLAGRGHVIPLTAELVVGDDDHRVLAAAAILDRPHQVDQMAASGSLAGVARVLVLRADRLHEADRSQVALALRRGSRCGHELLFVAQVSGAGGGLWRVVREV